MPPKSSWRLPRISCGRPARSALKRSARRSSSGRTLYFAGLDQEQPLQLRQLLRVLRREVVRLRPVVRAVELPDVVVERRRLGHHPRRAVTRHGGPALVVDAAVAEHLEVLRLAALGRRRVVEGGRHRDAVQRHLLDAVHERRARGSPAASSTVAATSMTWWNCVRTSPFASIPSASARSCRCACRPSATRPASSTGTACPSRAPSRPRSGCTPSGAPKSSMREVMNSTVSRPTAPFRTIELVEAPVRRSLGRGAIVADDHVDQRVVQHLEVGERVDQPADVVVGVLEEAGVDLHLAGEDRLHVVGRVVPGRDLVRPGGELRVGGDHAELLLARERLLAKRVPALVELALVLRRPLRRARGAGRASRRARSRRRTACRASAPSAARTHSIVWSVMSSVKW